jgi:acyl carrier protein
MPMTLSEIITDSFSLKEADQKDELVLSSLEEWESMTHMLFITRMEENFSVEFTGDDIVIMQRIGDIKKVLAKKGVTL